MVTIALTQRQEGKELTTPFTITIIIIIIIITITIISTLPL